MRLIGRDMSLFSVGPSGTQTAYITTVKSCEVNYRKDTQENGAVLDGFHFHQPIRSDWTISFSLAAQNAGAPAAFAQLVAGTSVLVTGFTGPTNITGLQFSGTGVLTDGRVNVTATGAQEHVFEIMAQSDLTFT